MRNRSLSKYHFFTPLENYNPYFTYHDISYFSQLFQEINLKNHSYPLNKNPFLTTRRISIAPYLLPFQINTKLLLTKTKKPLQRSSKKMKK